MHDMNFTAIDFETANEKRGSVIQVGLARVESGVVVDTAVRPIALHPTLNRFSRKCMDVHGLDASYIVGAEGWPEIMDFIGDFSGLDLRASGAWSGDLVAHNASVERSCIAQASEAWGVAASDLDWWCTLALAKTAMKTIDPGYTSPFKLEVLAEHFGIGDFTHHDAGEDAATTAQLTLLMAEQLGTGTVQDLWAETGRMRPAPQRR